MRGEDPGGRPPDRRPVLPRGLLHLHRLRGRAQRDLLHPGGGHLPTGLIVHDGDAQGGHQCPECWEAGLERCRHCGLAIKERIVRALDSAWHPACFRCRHVTLCHTMSMPHCSAMFHARCALCDTSLDGVPFLHKDNSLNCVGCFTK